MNKRTEPPTFEQDPLHQRLRSLRLDDPPSALRTRTLAAVQEETARRELQRTHKLSWTTELAFAAAILACVLVFPAVEQSSFPAEEPAAQSSLYEAERLARQIGLGDDFAGNLALRFAFQQEAAEKSSTPTERFHRVGSLLR